MALLHHAEMRPTKLELVEGWASAQPWFNGDVSAGLTSVGAFRFDDPDGQVGVETLLVRAGDGPTMQLPLTYRGSPLPGGEPWLIGTSEHSVLGTRWVYDGVGDPVYLLAVISAIVTGGHQAEMYFEDDGERVEREPTALVAGSGTSGTPLPSLPSVDEVSVRLEEGQTVVETNSLQVVVARVLGVGDATLRRETTGSANGVLSGTWSGQSEPQALVSANVR